MYDLRWFTPVTEVDLCGHATLASGFVVLVVLENEDAVKSITPAFNLLSKETWT